jgi:Glycosyltransferase family 87
LLPKLALAGGGVTALIDGSRLLYAVLVNGIDSLFNDFYDYWGAAVLLNRGGNPYDVNAIAGVLHGAGLHTEVGGGYSYPLLLAQVLRPLALLSPHTAALVFSALSVLALGLAASLILGAFQPLRASGAVVGGAVVAAFPPLMGSLYFGQVNLFVLVALAFAWRLVLPGPWLAAASAIKLYPVTGFITHLTRLSRDSWWQLISGGLLLVALILLPQIGAHGSFLSQSSTLLGPDTYWSNASVNGWISRLTLPSTWTTPPLPGIPTSTAVLIVCAALTLATVAILVRAGAASEPARLALCVWLGVVIAPKNSFWNFAPLILALASVWQLRANHRWPLVLAGAGWLLIQAQSQIDSARDTFYRGGSNLTWLSGLALYGALLIGAALVWLLLARPRLAP